MAGRIPPALLVQSDDDVEDPWSAFGIEKSPQTLSFIEDLQSAVTHIENSPSASPFANTPPINSSPITSSNIQLAASDESSKNITDSSSSTISHNTSKMDPSHASTQYMQEHQPENSLVSYSKISALPQQPVPESVQQVSPSSLSSAYSNANLNPHHNHVSRTSSEHFGLHLSSYEQSPHSSDNLHADVRLMEKDKTFEDPIAGPCNQPQDEQLGNTIASIMERFETPNDPVETSPLPKRRVEGPGGIGIASIVQRFEATTSFSPLLSNVRKQNDIEVTSSVAPMVERFEAPQDSCLLPTVLENHPGKQIITDTTIAPIVERFESPQKAISTQSEEGKGKDALKGFKGPNIGVVSSLFSSDTSTVFRDSKRNFQGANNTALKPIVERFEAQVMSDKTQIISGSTDESSNIQNVPLDVLSRRTVDSESQDPLDQRESDASPTVKKSDTNTKVAVSVEKRTKQARMSASRETSVGNTTSPEIETRLETGIVNLCKARGLSKYVEERCPKVEDDSSVVAVADSSEGSHAMDAPSVDNDDLSFLGKSVSHIDTHCSLEKQELPPLSLSSSGVDVGHLHQEHLGVPKVSEVSSLTAVCDVDKSRPSPSKVSSVPTKSCMVLAASSGDGSCRKESDETQPLEIIAERVKPDLFVARQQVQGDAVSEEDSASQVSAVSSHSSDYEETGVREKPAHSFTYAKSLASSRITEKSCVGEEDVAVDSAGDKDISFVEKHVKDHPEVGEFSSQAGPKAGTIVADGLAVKGKESESYSALSVEDVRGSLEKVSLASVVESSKHKDVLEGSAGLPSGCSMSPTETNSKSFFNASQARSRPKGLVNSSTGVSCSPPRNGTSGEKRKTRWSSLRDTASGAAASTFDGRISPITPPLKSRASGPRMDGRDNSEKVCTPKGKIVEGVFLGRQDRCLPQPSTSIRNRQEKACSTRTPSPRGHCSTEGTSEKVNGSACTSIQCSRRETISSSGKRRTTSASRWGQIGGRASGDSNEGRNCIDRGRTRLPRVAELVSLSPSLVGGNSSSLGRVPRLSTFAGSVPRVGACTSPSGEQARIGSSPVTPRGHASEVSLQTRGAATQLRRSLSFTHIGRATMSAAKSRPRGTVKGKVEEVKGSSNGDRTSRRVTISMSEGRSRPPRGSRPITIPQPFSLSGADLQEKSLRFHALERQKAEEIERRRRVFRASPMPDFSKPFPKPNF